MKKNLLSVAVKGAIGLTAAAVMVPATPAFAQEDATLVEEVVVTGSRIRRTDLESTSPVSIVSAEDMKVQGIVNVADALQQLTAQNGGLTSAVNNGGGGKSTVNLRGMGSQRTLVLLNGRRVTPSGIGANATVDLNTVPVAIIERIEVLKDGASAVYGSDAIAGVVNIITKKNFEGFQIDMQGGQSFESDGNETSVDITFGHSSDRGNITTSLGFYERGSVMQGDREFSECPLTDDADGTGVYCAGSTNTIGGNLYGTPAPVPDGWVQMEAPGSGGYHALTNDDRYNYAARSFNSTPAKRYNLNVNGNYQLTDTLEYFFEGSYNKRLSTQQMAPQPINYTLNNWRIPLDPDVYPFIGDYDFADPEDGEDSGNVALPLRRMTEVGDRIYEQAIDTVRLSTGFSGEVGEFYWDAALTYGRSDALDRSRNYINMDRVVKSVTDNCTDGDESTPCVNYLGEGALTPADVEYIKYDDQATGYSQQLVTEFNISGDLFELPAGVVGFAAGTSFREEKGAYQPDALTVAGLGSGNATSPTSGGYDVTEVYTEFSVPVFSDTAVGDLTADLAARGFDYSTFGSDSTWKAGLSWQINDMLKLRSVSSTAFRAPNIGELYGGQSSSYENFTDPCNDWDAPDSDAPARCADEVPTGFSQANDQMRALVGGNPDLMPETADTFTFGVVAEPLDGLSVTLDYFKTEIDNAIDSVEVNTIVQQCYTVGGVWCDSVQRDATNNIEGVEALDDNLATMNIDGVDAAVDYNFDAAGLSWRAHWETTQYLTWDYQPFEGADFIDDIGVGYASGGSLPEWKHKLAMSVAGDRWTAAYDMSYIGELTTASVAQDGQDPSEIDGAYVDGIFYHNASFSYNLTDALTLSGGVKNLLDEEPPYYYDNQDANTDQYLYDAVGRRWYMGATMSF
ncbi:TonB-dependent receptor [Microbulbifer halophilus]|uniref:TonB-dependent receptor n=1 Tax=Microbulbifer halophilus TaxID=453963 RepID=A0ABW5E9D8_9GAMM|nr:TonB-dependent receptor [Microbulbifer halophilus]MCW8125019.1 TonB-dependent receptor [Microbulbifer halophilus]